MKRNIKILFGILTMVIALVVTSCNDDEMLDSASIETISASAIFQGEDISLTGAGFESVKFVFLGYDQVEYGLEGNTITFTVPDEFPVGPTTVTLALEGGVRETIGLDVMLKPSPIITGFTAFVAAGDDLTIEGAQLDNNTTVTVDGLAASIVTVSDTELVVTVPSGVSTAGPIEFEIATDYGTASNRTAFYAKTNELANSTLELGEGDDFTGWDKLNGGDGMTAVSGEDGYGGSRSLHVVPAASNPWNTQFASTGVPLNFGDEYTIVLWAKGDAPGAVMRVSVSQWDGNGADYFYGADAELTTSWAQYTWTFTVSNDLPTHRVVLDMGAGSVPFTIDHIGLVPGTIGSAEAPNVMVDGGFEAGLPGDETGWSVLNGDVTVTTEADEVACGTNAVKAVGAAGNPWDTQLASAPIALEYEGTYEVSFWAKAAGDDGVIRISTSRYTDGSDPRSDYFYGHDITVGTDWTQYSYVFTVATDLPDGHNIVFDMGTTNQTFFIDEVTLKEYEAPEGILADPGFENGLPGDETGWTVLNGDITITTEADEVVSGNAIKVVGAGGNPWDTQLASNLVPLTQGNRYTVKLTAKAAGSDGVIRVSASRYTDGSDPRSDYYYSHDVTVGTDWTTYTFNFEALTDLPDGHNIVLDMGTTTQIFFIDNVIVYEIDGLECE